MKLNPEELRTLAYHNQVLRDLHDHLRRAGRFPTDTQAGPIRALFSEGKKVIMGQCGRSFGKALDLNTPILTTLGWKTMGTLAVGDFVFAPDGQPTRILGMSPVFYNRECFEVCFQDGTKMVADKEHLWLTDTKEVRKSNKQNRGKFPKRSPIKTGRVVSTGEIRETLKTRRRGENNHRIPVTAPVFYPYRELPLSPYVLGVWLGDGNSRGARIYTQDLDILENIKKEGFDYRKAPSDSIGYTVSGLSSRLNQLGLYKNKRIPKDYLYSSEEQRTELLRGLLDTDGDCNENGIEFVNTNKRIADGVYWLAVSLGMKATRTTKVPTLNGKPRATAYRLRLIPNRNLFKVRRKGDRLASKIGKIRNFDSRYICAVNPVPSRPVRCIAVEHDTHLYLAGEALVPTHNTEDILYIAWRWALTYPNSEVYIICPERLQAKKIYWLAKRLQYYGPQKYVKEHRESELRTVLKNDSYIILDGCENYAALRGIKPRLVIYDEFQHHSRDFDEEVMQPNLASGTPLVVMGTPPKHACYYTEFREHHIEMIARGDTSRYYMELPTWCNPTQNKVWLENKRLELLRRKRYNVWLREYEGRLVFDTESAIFPTYDDTVNGRHVFPPSFIDLLITKDKPKLQWFAVFDPGTTTCFAVLFACINPYTSQVFILDEIYEKERERTQARLIWERANEIKKKYFPRLGEWRNIYDEAAAWFANEVLSFDQASLIPTRKQRNRTLDDARPGESLIKTIMDTPNRLFISEKCVNLRSELTSYVTNEKGQYPTKNDHLIDDLHYLVTDSFFSLVEEPLEEETLIVESEKMFNELSQSYDGEPNDSLWDNDGMEDIWINWRVN